MDIVIYAVIGVIVLFVLLRIYARIRGERLAKELGITYEELTRKMRDK